MCNIPHKALILIRYEVMEVNPDGKTDKCKLSKKKIISISGSSQEDCMEKLEQWLKKTEIE